MQGFGSPSHERSQCQRNIKTSSGVSAVVQWVKNLTAVAQVTATVWVWGPAWCSGLKDLALPHLQHRSKLQLGLGPWPGNFHMPQVQPLKRKEKKLIYPKPILIQMIEDNTKEAYENISLITLGFFFFLFPSFCIVHIAKGLVTITFGSKTRSKTRSCLAPCGSRLRQSYE